MTAFSKPDAAFLQHISRIIRHTKPEVILIYFLLRRNGRSQDEISSGILLQDLMAENLLDAFHFLKEDLKRADPQILDELEVIHRNYLEIQPLPQQQLLLENIIQLSAANNIHGPAAYSLPLPLAGFLLDLLEIKRGTNIYNPFAGLATFGTVPTKGTYLGQELVQSNWLLGLLRLANTESHLVSIESGDSITKWRGIDGPDDVIVANPPYGGRLQEPMETEFGLLRTFEEFVLYKSTIDLKENQKVLLLMPSSILSAKSPFLTAYRKYLVDSGLLSIIIQFPSGILSSTGLNLCALIFDTECNFIPHTRMIDLTKVLGGGKRTDLSELPVILKKIKSEKKRKWIREVRIDEIYDNDFDLNIFRYWIPKFDGIGVTLSDIIDPKNGHNKFSEPVTIYGKVPVVKIKDLKNDPVNFILRANELPKVMEPMNGSYVTESCLLLSMRFTDLKPTWLEVNGTPIFVVSDIRCFSIDKERIHLPYLIQELSSSKVKEQVKGLSSTGTIPRLSLKDLKRIKIVLPDLEEQKEQVARNLRNIVQEEEERLAELRKEFGMDKADELSYLRHSLAGSVKKSRDAMEDLEKIIFELADKHPDILSAQAENNTTLPLLKYMEILKRELENARLVLSRASLDIDLGKMELEDILLVDFLEKYAQELKYLKRGDFSVQFDYDHLVIDKKLRKQLYIKADRGLLKRVFDNIVENAEKHGFTGISFEERELQIELLYDQGDKEIQIDFGNTGNPLPENYSHENFIRKGSRTGNQAGDGYGGHLINTILHAFNGRIGFTDETGPEGFGGKYTTTFEVYLTPVIKI